MNFMIKDCPIGVFDSGIGGLTVVKRLNEILPNENIIYFGDTARVPYGSKSNETVIEYAIQDAKFLVNKNVKMIIVACNTASSVALEELQSKFDIPVIGMIEPGAKYALENTKKGKIGVIGTYATISNKAYSHQLRSLKSDLEIFEKACPLFVPLAEEGMTDHKATELIAQDYLSPLKENEIDTLILGCTHYPILADVISKVIGENVALVDSGIAAAKEVSDYLNGRGIKNDSNNIGYVEFYVSDVQTKFKEVAERFLGRPIKEINKVEVDTL